MVAAVTIASLPLVAQIAGTSAAAAAAGSSLRASALVARIKGPSEVRLHDVHVVDGPLDLRALKAIHKSIRCTNCTIDGGLTARDVTFERMIDLTDVTINGPVDVSGATFNGPVLARSTGGSARVTGAANFSFTRFSG